MKRLGRVLRIFLGILILPASLATLSGWWLLHHSLPAFDGEISFPELHHEVLVDRNSWGIPHIRAESLEDLVTAQGYVMAQDRLWQMDVLRRAAAGDLSEIFGAAALDNDRENRTLGLRAAAERSAALLKPEYRALLEAYARGVNRNIQERGGNLPGEFLVLRYKPRPWTPVDSLLIGGFMHKELTSFWRGEVRRGEISALVGPDRAHELYTVDSAWDRVLVGTETEGKSARNGEAVVRSSLVERTSSRLYALADFPAGVPQAPAIRWEAVQRVLQTFGDEARAAAGSNNWVVSGKHTYSGKPILANDTHLPLNVPSIWYLLHLTAPGWNVRGFALPGVPLVMIGHNERIAWGVTNTGADVQDVYIETFRPEKPLEYKVNGEWRKAEVRRETIHVRGQADEILDVVLTRHGPVVSREKDRGYSVRWTATEPGGLDFTFPLLGNAHNWAEFRETLRGLAGPAQNFVYADVDGNIGFQVAAKIPVRRKPAGGVPVPGDTDDYEWTGYIPFEELPQLYNPPEGVIATANARVVGPKYRWYLTDDWMAPYRTGRIYTLLGQHPFLRPADCIKIQTDTLSPPLQQVAEELLRARKSVRPLDPRADTLIQQLPKWDGRASVDSLQAPFLEFTRRAILWHLLQPLIGAGVGRYQWERSSVFLENVLRDRPGRWLPPGFRTYDELLITSAELAVQQMELESGGHEPREWQWGTFTRLRIFHPLGQHGLLRRQLSIGPLAISGSQFSVKQIGRGFAPSMRFVADLANFDNSMMNITLGESGQYLSANYRDQFPSWYEGKGIGSEFSDAVQEKTRLHRLHLRPQPAH